MSAQLALVQAHEQAADNDEPKVPGLDREMSVDMEEERLELLSRFEYVDFGNGRGMWICPSTD